jgi:hypothetical protein
LHYAAGSQILPLHVMVKSHRCMMQRKVVSQLHNAAESQIVPQSNAARSQIFPLHYEVVNHDSPLHYVAENRNENPRKNLAAA